MIQTELVFLKHNYNVIGSVQVCRLPKVQTFNEMRRAMDQRYVPYLSPEESHNDFADSKDAVKQDNKTLRTFQYQNLTLKQLLQNIGPNAFLPLLDDFTDNTSQEQVIKARWLCIDSWRDCELHQLLIETDQYFYEVTFDT